MERIQLPSITNQFHSYSPILLLSDPHQVKPTWSTPPVHQTSVVFPPTNHENLNLHTQVDVLETCNEKDKPPSPPEIAPPVEVKWWLYQFKLPASVKSLLRLFNFPIFGSTVLMLLLYLRFRRHRRRQLRGKVVDELVGVIKEKDERIQRLLLQIARMNELLLAKYHGVPMVSKAATS